MKIQIGSLSLRLFVKTGTSGLLMAHSPDLPGLNVMERTWDELVKQARELAPVLIADRARRS